MLAIIRMGSGAVETRSSKASGENLSAILGWIGPFSVMSRGKTGISCYEEISIGFRQGMGEGEAGIHSSSTGT